MNELMIEERGGKLVLIHGVQETLLNSDLTLAFPITGVYRGMRAPEVGGVTLKMRERVAFFLNHDELLEFDRLNASDWEAYKQKLESRATMAREAAFDLLAKSKPGQVVAKIAAEVIDLLDEKRLVAAEARLEVAESYWYTFLETHPLPQIVKFPKDVVQKFDQYSADYWEAVARARREFDQLNLASVSKPNTSTKRQLTPEEKKQKQNDAADRRAERGAKSAAAKGSSGGKGPQQGGGNSKKAAKKRK